MSIELPRLPATLVGSPSFSFSPCGTPVVSNWTRVDGERFDHDDGRRNTPPLAPPSKGGERVRDKCRGKTAFVTKQVFTSPAWPFRNDERPFSRAFRLTRSIYVNKTCEKTPRKNWPGESRLRRGTRFCRLPQPSTLAKVSTILGLSTACKKLRFVMLVHRARPQTLTAF
jgi:hypothetical protein